MWYDVFDAVFFITVSSMVVGVIGLSIKYCLKSKCEHCNIMYGCIKIDRKVELETNDVNPSQSQTDLAESSMVV